MNNRIYRSEYYANRDLASRGARSAATDKILRRHDARIEAARTTAENAESVALLAYCCAILALIVVLFYSIYSIYSI